MLAWLGAIGHALINQTAVLIVSAFVAVFGVFSNVIVERVKFALNKADLRTKYYEEFSESIGVFMHSIDRYLRVGRSKWVTEEGGILMASMYDESAYKLWTKEHIYYSWIKRYWNRTMQNLFREVMAGTRRIDATLIKINDADENKDDAKVEQLLEDLKIEFEGLKSGTNKMLDRMV